MQRNNNRMPHRTYTFHVHFGKISKVYQTKKQDFNA